MPAKSKAQQKKRRPGPPWPSSGGRPASPASKVLRRRCSKSMTEDELVDFASTTHDQLPEKVDEDD